MLAEFYKSAVVPIGEGEKVTYSLTRHQAALAGSLDCELYGVQIDMGEETACCPRLTASRKAAGELLELLARGGVTPVGLAGVVDDWKKA